MNYDARKNDGFGPSGGGKLGDNIVHFARLLRDAGLPIGPGRVLNALEAAQAGCLQSRATTSTGCCIPCS